MKKSWLGLICVVPAILCAQNPQSNSQSSTPGVMVVGVAHDDSVMAGGISSGKQLPLGRVDVQPIAWVSADGEWKKLSCNEAAPRECKAFDRDYLGKPHDYTVVSADGNGAAVHVDRMAISDECFGIEGSGTFSGGPIRFAAVGAESVDIFVKGDAARRLSDHDAEPVRTALSTAVGKKLDSTKELRVYALQMGGMPLLVVQRAFGDWANKPEYAPPNDPAFDEIFAIGTMRNGHFQLLFWKENTGDDNEQILGLIHMTKGNDFLVTSSNNPEGSSFRIYGVRNGKVVVILEGGGGEC